MREAQENFLWERLEARCRESGVENVWRRPVVKYADAADTLFVRLRELVVESHYVPQDYMDNARTVISWFLPFVPAVGRGNAEAGACTATWATAYVHANALAAQLNEDMAGMLYAQGVEACVPRDAGMIGPDMPKSRWSQRHVAYIAGHGTFGLNNMLISDKGSVGRYYSLVTTLDVPPDPLVREERCLFKRDGSCGLCVRRCFTGALTERGFDRFACLGQCLKNEALYAGADVCGKCVVELPCSHV